MHSRSTKSQSLLLPLMRSRIVMFVLVASVPVIVACASGSNDADAAAETLQNELVALVGGYLESKDAPEVPLWDEDGAPAFFQESCASFVSFGQDENSISVKSEGEGKFVLTLVNLVEGQSDVTYSWRIEAETADVTPLQEVC